MGCSSFYDEIKKLSDAFSPRRGRRPFFDFFMKGGLFFYSWILICIPVGAQVCGHGEGPLSQSQRQQFMSQLRGTIIGQRLIREYEEKFQNWDRISIFWDSVSYSQILPDQQQSCLYISTRLPLIEQLADFTHELVHITRMPRVRWEEDSLGHFIERRISGVGGEADAFATECSLKREILGHYDDLCSPYTSIENGKKITMDPSKIARALSDGELSASLTGETYPVMLARQFQVMRSRSQAQ